MATTSLLYHGFGLHLYRLLRTEYREGRAVFHIALKEDKRRCALCQSRDVIKAGTFVRQFRSVPIGLKGTRVVLHGHRQQCYACGGLCQEAIHFADSLKRYTRAFARMVVELSRHMALSHVAMFLRIGWDLVKDIYARHLRKRLKRRRFSKVRYIAVDEFAVRKGHKYITVVMDLETGAVLYGAQGKGAEALIPFLRQLKRARAPLRAVAMDMSGAYAKAVKTVFPSLERVYDPYHVVALVNKAIDDVRKDLYGSLAGQERKVLKGSRYLLLQGMEKLTPKGLDRLTMLMESNEPLYAAYLLKEDLRRFWDFSTRDQAAVFLADWLEQAVDSALKPFIQLALTLIRHLDGLLAYFLHRISTGPLEGMNNKIKVLKRQAYGYRDMDFFILRLLFIHESTYAVTG
jgi:transposase